MSWSKAASGNADQIREQARGWKDSQLKQDDSYGAVQGIKDGHSVQIDAAVETAKSIVDAFPDRNYSISASGHAGNDGGGFVTVGYSMTAVTVKE